LRWGLYFGVEDVSVKYLQFGGDNLFQVDVICTSYYSYMLLKGVQRDEIHCLRARGCTECSSESPGPTAITSYKFGWLYRAE